VELSDVLILGRLKPYFHILEVTDSDKHSSLLRKGIQSFVVEALPPFQRELKTFFSINLFLRPLANFTKLLRPKIAIGRVNPYALKRFLR
jgi:hypothetical protein